MALQDIERRARSIFERAIELPGTRVDSFVREQCAGDEDLFNAVCQLWEGYQNRSFLDLASSGGPRRIGRFEIQGVVGRGGMGIVYVGYDPTLSRRVAIKTFYLTELADGQPLSGRREQLLQEAKSGGMLDHPNIVTVHDVGEDNGTPFIVMELLEGPSLLGRMSAGPLSWGETLSILTQTAEALDFAHRAGVVHRDVKPGNIMLDRASRVKLTDFGIAKLREKRPRDLTFKGYGTPFYMSPEQVEAREVGGQSDQFSLAVVAYQMLTGDVPFRKESDWQTMQAIASLTRPSAYDANPSLPIAVDAPLIRALAIVPEQRFRTCKEFVDALSTALAGSRSSTAGIWVDPQATERMPRIQRPPDWKTRRKRVGAKVAVSTIILVGLGALALVFGHRFASTGEKPPAGPQIKLFEADSHSVPVGTAVTLHWNVSGATRVIIDGGVGEVAQSGTVQVRPKTTGYYTLRAYGSGREATAKSLVAVQTAMESTRAPRIVRFSTDPDVVPEGGSFTLRWKVENAQNIAINQGIGNVASEGSRTLIADESKTYALTASSGSRVPASTASVTVNIKRASAAIDGEGTGAGRNGAAANGAGLRREEASHLDTEDAQSLLERGKSAYLGRGRPRDEGDAAQLFQKATELGNTEAMVLLGTMYAQGSAVPRDYARAVHLFQQAANAGNIRGMDNLAHMYADGYGVTRNPEQATVWYRKAADAGDADATYHLGLMYERGAGVPENREQARRLYARAAALGKSEAAMRLKLIAGDNTMGRSTHIALVATDPGAIQLGRARQYKLVGSGFSVNSLIFVEGASYVGSRLGAINNHRPVEAAANGSWLRIYIYVDGQTRATSSTITVQNGADRASLVVPIMR